MPVSPELRIASVIASFTAGGIGPVCRYAAEGMAMLTNWHVTLVSLHDPKAESVDERTDVRVVSLGLDGNCSRRFLDWLALNPQDILITSDVSRIEPAYRFLPPSTVHVMQIHDSARRYRDVAVRHAAWVDGVTCVGRHIEGRLREALTKAGFRGLVRTIHNGARFPPVPLRQVNHGPLRLLYVGAVSALKGVFDFTPLLQKLKQADVPAVLNIVGGDNSALRREFERRGVASMVTWTGYVPHERCYEIAAEADVFLMASRKESFGMATIEAMSMGCVPIAYDIPSGSTEIIEHEKSGMLVPLGDLRTWAGHVRAMHLDRKWLMELSAAAIVRARTCFDAETMARNMAGFLADVAEHSARHPSIRQPGLPPETPKTYAATPRGYQRLPEWLREWIRNKVGASPRLSYWLLNR